MDNYYVKKMFVVESQLKNECHKSEILLEGRTFYCLSYYAWPIICLATKCISLFGLSGFLFLALRCTAVIVKTHNLLPALQMFLATVEQQQ